MQSYYKDYLFAKAAQRQYLQLHGENKDPFKLIPFATKLN